MFQRILVPVDLTDKHQRALEIALQLAGQSGGEVTLLHVIELIQGLSMDEERGFYQRLERTARARLERLRSALPEHKVPLTIEVVFGDRAHEILQHAAHTGTELIVLTSHRVDPANPGTHWGTLSYKLGILAQCPILLVK